MDSTKLFKIVAIVIVAVMALSMIAAGFLYLENGASQSSTGNSSQSPDSTSVPNATPFTYSFSFDTNALRDVGTLRMGAFTSVLDKSLIDSAVLNIDGVSKVNSQFSKNSQDANNWVYLADVSLKKTADEVAVAAAILDLNFFLPSKKADFLAAKYITISAPAFVLLHNSDLNIDRNYSFPSATLSALSGLSTLGGDALIVGGSITLQGNNVTALSIVEEQNLSQMPSVDTNGVVIDANSVVVDANSVVSDGNVFSADKNA